MLRSAHNISEAFLASLSGIDQQWLNEDNVNKIKACLIDYLAAHAAGKLIVSDKVSSFISKYSFDLHSDGVPPRYDRLGLDHQVFLTGLVSHAAELDDGSRFGMIHPGAPLFSLLLPVTRKKAVAFHEFALATLIGYEASIRTAMSMAPGHYARGFHPTATCGTIGASLGLATLLQIDPSTFKDVLSVAALSATGTLKVIEDDSQIKPFNVANAAINGLYAVRMAISGFKGANDPLGGSVGFLSMMTDQWHLDKLVRNSTESLMIHSVYFKPYAACRHAHAPIEAALVLRNQWNIIPESIKAVNVYVYSSIIGKHDGRAINSSTSAKMSLPFAIAVAIVTGGAGIEQFEEPWVSDPLTHLVMNKINIIPDDYFSSLVPAKRCTRVEFLLKDGSHFDTTVEFAKGEPENPMTDADLFFKLGNSLRQNGKVNANEVFGAVDNMENDMAKFYEILEKLEI